MSDVKRYHVTEAGLVEGQALGRFNVVLGADHDRVTAERDALQLSLTAADERADQEVIALNEIARVSRMGEKPFEIATLAIGEMSALKPAEATHDFSMIGTEKMPPMEYDEP